MIATFSSNIYRIQEVINSTIKHSRKLIVMGRSMVNAVETSLELGYLEAKGNIIIDISEMKNYKDDEIVILTTGSQGKPMAALSRMASGDHRQVEVRPNDKIIIWVKIKSVISDTIREFVWKKTKRNPMILPIIIDVKE